jgi:hypothetical protein
MSSIVVEKRYAVRWMDKFLRLIRNTIGKIAICFLVLPFCFLVLPFCFLVLVFSASKQSSCFLILPVGFLISVNRAFIWVVSASKQGFCFLILPVCFLISVDRAFILGYPLKAGQIRRDKKELILFVPLYGGSPMGSVEFRNFCGDNCATFDTYQNSVMEPSYLLAPNCLINGIGAFRERSGRKGTDDRTLSPHFRLSHRFAAIATPDPSFH